MMISRVREVIQWIFIYLMKPTKVATKPASTSCRKENMLKFLTHKLRTHSINEDNFIEKVCNLTPSFSYSSVTSLKVTTRWKMAAPSDWNKGMLVPVLFFPIFYYITEF